MNLQAEADIMFGFGRKAKFAQGIQNAMFDVMNGRFASKDECLKLCQSDVGGKCLFEEMILQLSNALAFVVWSESKHHSWATLEFFLKNAIKPIANPTEKAEMFSKIVHGIKRLQAIPGVGQERLKRVYFSSAQAVIDQDPNIDSAKLVKFIAERTNLFLEKSGDYFE